MRKFFIISHWWDNVMGWWLFLRQRPRCANAPFKPAPDNIPSQDLQNQAPAE